MSGRFRSVLFAGTILRMLDDDMYMSVEEAAALLRITTRQARRYQEKVRSKVVGKRLLLHRGDITELSRRKNVELQARDEAHQYQEQRPKTELIAPGEMLSFLREREAYAERLHQQLVQAAHRIGELETQLAQRLLPHDVEALQQQLSTAQQEQERLLKEHTQLQHHHSRLQDENLRLQKEVKRLSKSWWKRLLRS